MTPLTLISMRILRDLTKKRWSVAWSKNRDNTTTSPSQARDMAPRDTTVFSPISRLPPELIDEIMLYLPASSVIAFRRCNKRLYINGGPEPSNLLYSRLSNDENKDDHLRLLCLLERDAPQRVVCSVCIRMHKKEVFSTAETSKPSESRKCRMVQICPHRNLTFPQLQRIVSTYSNYHGNPQQPPLDCTFADCPTNQSGVYCERKVKVEYEDCSTTWPYNRVWKRNLYLCTSWVIYSGECICTQRSEESLLWTWPLCPHIVMKDCCNCCRVADPGHIELHPRYWHGHTTDTTDTTNTTDAMERNALVMQCKLCRTRINTCEFGKLQDRRVVIVDRYLGRGESIEDADWLRQTMPEAICQSSRQSKRGGLGVVAAYCSAIISDLWPRPHRSAEKSLHSSSADN